MYLSYARINQFIGLMCGCRVFLYGDEFNPNEKSVILCNHKAIYDILSIFYVSGHFNRVVGFCLKKQVSQLPGPGWWCTRMKFPTLNRDISDLHILAQDTTPFPNVIYPEGTRYTNKKYRESCDFAKKNDYPISKYAQLPKYKGAFTLTKNIVYQMTLVYLDKHQRIITGEIREFPSRVYIHVKKHVNVPKDEAEYKTWLQKEFAKIDDIYENFKPNNAIEMLPNYQTFDYFMYAGYALVQLALLYQLLILIV
jgi:1-acyl-sn-glycerol-3-phosphate acyltransferase